MHIGTGGVIRVAGMAATGNKVVLANTSGDLSALAVGTTAQFLRGDGTWQLPPTGTNFWSLNASNNIYNNNSGSRVGIGVSAPAVKLDVAGNGTVSTPLWYRTGATSENLNIGIRVASTATTLVQEYPILGSVRATSAVTNQWFAHGGVAGLAYNLDGTRLLSLGVLGIARATGTYGRDYYGVLGVLDADDATAIGALSASAAVHGTIIDYNSASTPNIYSGWFYGAPVRISDLGASGNVAVYADNDGVLKKGSAFVTVKAGVTGINYELDPTTDTSFSISFGHTFASPPVVTATLRRVAGNVCEAYLYVSSVTTTGATLILSGAQNAPDCYDGQKFDAVYWTAVGN